MNSFLILSHPGQAQHFNPCNLQLCLLCHCLGAIYLVYPSKRLQSCKKKQKKLMLSPNVFSRVRTGFCKNAAGKMCFHLISQEPEPLPDIFIYISLYKRHDSPPSPQIRTSAENPSMAALKTLLLTHSLSGWNESAHILSFLAVRNLSHTSWSRAAANSLLPLAAGRRH